MGYDQQKIVEAIRAFENGEIVVVMDDDDRENEGDLIVSAVHCTAEKMAFIIRHVAVVFGDVRDGQNIPVRLQIESVIDDAFGASSQLPDMLEKLAQNGRGILVYLREGSVGVNGRGILVYLRILSEFFQHVR